IVAWCQQHQRQLEKASRALTRERAWAVQIEQEASVHALLAHHVTRACLWCLVRGEKSVTGKITDWTRSRKAVAAAKQILQARQKRRDDRGIAERASLGHTRRIYL